MKIDFRPLKLDYGGPEEVATFGQLIITHGDFCLTRGVSQIDGADAYLEGPHISGCLLAEWMAWNWWRLRWESFPQGPATDSWNFAHCMSSIGGGYTWPNIAIASDGFRCEMTSTASREPHSLSYQYIGLPAPPGKLTFPASDFERECAAFVERTLDLCNAADLHDTDLAQIWQELNAERSDPELCSLRRLEALLGRDPGELNQKELTARQQDAEILGTQAVEELAIDAGQSSSEVISWLSAQEVVDRTRSEGVEMRSSDAAAAPIPANSWGSKPAWRLGVDLAEVIRHQAGLGLDPIGNDRLAELAGMAERALTTPGSGAQDLGSVSWTLRQNGEERMVFRSRRDTSRRFDAARLVADGLFSMDQFNSEEAMLPATRTHSYRQKAQRAFAGELLCPWPAAVERLGNDYSQENQQQVADEFGVSPMVINVKIRSHVDIYGNVAAMV